MKLLDELNIPLEVMEYALQTFLIIQSCTEYERMEITKILNSVINRCEPTTDQLFLARLKSDVYIKMETERKALSKKLSKKLTLNEFLEELWPVSH